MTDAKPKSAVTPKKAAAGCGCLILLLVFLLFLIGMCAAPVETEDKAAGAGKGSAPAIKTTDETKDQAARFWAELKAAQRDCDLTGKLAIKAFQGYANGETSVVRAYQSATEAKTSCEASWMVINRLRPPAAATGEAKKAYEKAIEDCGNAYFAKREGYKTLAKILDGDAKPSMMAEFERQAGAAQGGQLVCVAAVAAASDPLGYMLPELMTDEEKAAP